MLEEEVYEIPMTEAVDGLNLDRLTFGIVYDDSRIDDTRLERGNDLLVASYPRTGKLIINSNYRHSEIITAFLC